MKKTCQLFTILSFLTLIANCGPVHQTGASESPLEGLDADQSIALFESTLKPILTQNCQSCHGASQAPRFAVADSIESHNFLLNSSLVSLANPSVSRLVDKIAGGHQGMASSLATEIETAITDWSDQLTN